MIMAGPHGGLQLGPCPDRLRACGLAGGVAISKEEAIVRLSRWSCVALTAAIMMGFAASAMAADVKPKTVVFKAWTLDCVAPAAAAGETTKPKPFCIIHHEVHPQSDQTKTVLIARTRFVGKTRTPAMVLLLPPVANLQKGVVFSVDRNTSFKANIASCSPQYCTALFGISDVVLKQLKGGTQLTLGFAMNNGQPPVQFVVPLEGYGPAFDALQKSGL